MSQQKIHSNIHPTAIIDPSAELADDIEIGPYSVIGKKVKIDTGNKIGSHVVINGPTFIGKDNTFYQFGSIGEAPQDKKYQGEETTLEIGDRNVVREFTTLNRGTVQDRGATTLGDDNLIMAYVHIAHDCVLGSDIILANNVALAGHVNIHSQAILGGFSLVHQFCTVGSYAFTAMNSVISKDVPPYVMVSGHMAKPHGLNMEGLKRQGFSTETIKSIRNAYKALYRSNLTLDDAVTEINELATNCAELAPMIDFLENNVKRGIIR
ncbi:MAG: acyl-ACP--UDP-N-acetylglucosamine O-acyltransferase [gamma proteobacterium symbiont of Bathyaustriella thionipta]|nr:acyl-ACP--UDP-N-acetylglucosamine O-acyltransferase [gamma proteobacterium symbiont of Bathyaustriella thionipta]MCU7948575.1 acyl-ACP--UDP-N-acetylglucosamine O-acyltransferase [gamma proteobacterium symbiont of Bathyaustriella thionipta]MCU7953304.1 acyl-ACP--UDP-N-acetylglucosamine O-acyltransferase [gamma proteobacterium symbiont of Bathyaustriella thionipta]MCU7955081.1 acyl-ACP--UDP-N-acetylglucosamine O-acyltransferase [gamma proteobacterium symbiont of Bathyaustriella thionipta]MCU79